MYRNSEIAKQRQQESDMIIHRLHNQIADLQAQMRSAPHYFSETINVLHSQLEKFKGKVAEQNAEYMLLLELNDRHIEEISDIRQQLSAKEAALQSFEKENKLLKQQLMVQGKQLHDVELRASQYREISYKLVKNLQLIFKHHYGTQVAVLNRMVWLEKRVNTVSAAFTKFQPPCLVKQNLTGLIEAKKTQLSCIGQVRSQLADIVEECTRSAGQLGNTLVSRIKTLLRLPRYQFRRPWSGASRPQNTHLTTVRNSLQRSTHMSALQELTRRSAGLLTTVASMLRRQALCAKLSAAHDKTKQLQMCQIEMSAILAMIQSLGTQRPPPIEKIAGTMPLQDSVCNYAMAQLHVCSAQARVITHYRARLANIKQLFPTTTIRQHAARVTNAMRQLIVEQEKNARGLLDKLVKTQGDGNQYEALEQYIAQIKLYVAKIAQYAQDEGVLVKRLRGPDSTVVPQHGSMLQQVLVQVAHNYSFWKSRSELPQKNNFYPLDDVYHGLVAELRTIAAQGALIQGDVYGQIVTMFQEIDRAAYDGQLNQLYPETALMPRTDTAEYIRASFNCQHMNELIAALKQSLAQRKVNYKFVQQEDMKRNYFGGSIRATDDFVIFSIFCLVLYGLSPVIAQQNAGKCIFPALKGGTLSLACVQLLSVADADSEETESL